MRSPWYTTWPGNFHHDCFAREVYDITDCRLLVAIISNDVANLSQHLQCTMLCIHQYSVHIVYKAGPDLYIANWLSCNNHTENSDQDITGVNINEHAISTSVNIPICTSIEDIQVASQQDTDL